MTMIVMEVTDGGDRKNCAGKKDVSAINSSGYFGMFVRLRRCLQPSNVETGDIIQKKITSATEEDSKSRRIIVSYSLKGFD